MYYDTTKSYLGRQKGHDCANAGVVKVQKDHRTVITNTDPRGERGHRLAAITVSKMLLEMLVGTAPGEACAPPQSAPHSEIVTHNIVVGGVPRRFMFLTCPSEGTVFLRCYPATIVLSHVNTPWGQDVPPACRALAERSVAAMEAVAFSATQYPDTTVKVLQKNPVADAAVNSFLCSVAGSVASVMLSTETRVALLLLKEVQKLPAEGARRFTWIEGAFFDSERGRGDARQLRYFVKLRENPAIAEQWLSDPQKRETFRQEAAFDIIADMATYLYSRELAGLYWNYVCGLLSRGRTAVFAGKPVFDSGFADRAEAKCLAESERTVDDVWEHLSVPGEADGELTHEDTPPPVPTPRITATLLSPESERKVASVVVCNQVTEHKPRIAVVGWRPATLAVAIYDVGKDAVPTPCSVVACVLTGDDADAIYPAELLNTSIEFVSATRLDAVALAGFTAVCFSDYGIAPDEMQTVWRLFSGSRSCKSLVCFSPVPDVDGRSTPETAEIVWDNDEPGQIYHYLKESSHQPNKKASKRHR